MEVTLPGTPQISLLLPTERFASLKFRLHKVTKAFLCHFLNIFISFFSTIHKVKIKKISNKNELILLNKKKKNPSLTLNFIIINSIKFV